MFPQLARFTDLGLLLLRLMVAVAVVFIASGYNQLKDPEGRSKSIEMPKGSRFFSGSPRSLAAWESPLAFSRNSPLSD